MVEQRNTPRTARRRRAFRLYAECIDMGADPATTAALDTGELFALRGRLLLLSGRL